MNRAEAIQKIEAIIDNGQDYGYWTDAQRKAFDFAIEALGEPSVSEKERVVDRARRKLGDKVTIPAVVEEIEYTTLGEINYKVVPLNTWFDADEIEALGQTEIVRCKDCRHSRIEGDTTKFLWCGYWNKPTDGIRYCSDGERSK